MRRSDPLIAGGGPAGSAAAITLAAAGHRPVVLERQRETGDALCGGFLSWRTLETLERLGVSLPDGHPIETLRIFAAKRRSEARLPRLARAISRRRLDTALLDRAEAEGAGVERGVALRSWSDGAVTTADGGVLRPETLFLATGKHDLRGIARPRTPDAEQTLGLRVLLSPHPELQRLVGNAIELHLFEQGYCGVALQEGGRGNLCLAVRKTRLAMCGGDPDRLLADWAAESPAFAERLAHRSSTIDAIGSVPYGWIAGTTEPGVYRLGDQAAVIPSLAGEGSGIALASGHMAALRWIAGESAQAFQEQLALKTARPVSVAGRLWHWGESPGSAQFLALGVRLAPWLAGRLADWTRIRH